LLGAVFKVEEQVIPARSLFLPLGRHVHNRCSKAGHMANKRIQFGDLELSRDVTCHAFRRAIRSCYPDAFSFESVPGTDLCRWLVFA